MDFSWPQEYKDYREKLVSFASEELCDDIIERDYKGQFSRSLWNKCGEFGILGLASLPQYGGTHTEIDVLRACYALQGFGYGCDDVGLGLAINAHLWTVQMTISKFGSNTQKEKFLP